MGEPRVDVSVIVPFRDAEAYLADQLEALGAQEFGAEWEVIAVDNGSRDESRRLVETFAARLPLRVVDASGGKGPGYARNVGAQYARGKKLVFVDADDEVAPGFVAAMAAALDRHDFVTSRFDSVTLNARWVRAAHGEEWRDPDHPLPPQFGFLPIAAGSIGLAQSVFESVGGFPEEFGRLQDTALSWKVQLAGVELGYADEAVYRVRYRSTLWGLFRQSWSWGTHAPLLYRHFREMGMPRRTPRQVARGWLVLAWQLARARSREEFAPLLVRLGGRLGRVRGSVRYRVVFL